jgi:His/Glu/Gln/Arg/opine family amino acid ABC transporter permease subunit
MQTAPHFLAILLGGAVVAVEVAAGALLVALAGGLILALMTVAPLRPLRWIARAYIELIRGTPALTQLFIIYFGLSDVGLELSPMTASVAAATNSLPCLPIAGCPRLMHEEKNYSQPCDRSSSMSSLVCGCRSTSAPVWLCFPTMVRLKSSFLLWRTVECTKPNSAPRDSADSPRNSCPARLSGPLV